MRRNFLHRIVAILLVSAIPLTSIEPARAGRCTRPQWGVDEPFASQALSLPSENTPHKLTTSFPWRLYRLLAAHFMRKPADLDPVPMRHPSLTWTTKDVVFLGGLASVFIYSAIWDYSTFHVWADRDLRFETMALFPMSMIGALVGDVTAQWIEMKKSSRRRFELGQLNLRRVGNLLFVAVYSATIENLIYILTFHGLYLLVSGVLHALAPTLPGLLVSVAAALVAAIIDIRWISPRVTEPLAYFVYARYAERNGTDEEAVKEIRENAVEVYAYAAPVWFSMVWLSVLSGSPILSYICLSIAILYWNIVFSLKAGEQRSDFLQRWRQHGFLKRFVPFLEQVQTRYDRMDISASCRGWLSGLITLYISVELYLWHAPHWVLTITTVAGFMLLWRLISIRVSVKVQRISRLMRRMRNLFRLFPWLAPFILMLAGALPLFAQASPADPAAPPAATVELYSDTTLPAGFHRPWFQYESAQVSVNPTKNLELKALFEGDHSADAEGLQQLLRSRWTATYELPKSWGLSVTQTVGNGSHPTSMGIAKSFGTDTNSLKLEAWESVFNQSGRPQQAQLFFATITHAVGSAIVTLTPGLFTKGSLRASDGQLLVDISLGKVHVFGERNFTQLDTVINSTHYTPDTRNRLGIKIDLPHDFSIGGYGVSTSEQGKRHFGFGFLLDWTLKFHRDSKKSVPPSNPQPSQTRWITYPGLNDAA